MWSTPKSKSTYSTRLFCHILTFRTERLFWFHVSGASQQQYVLLSYWVFPFLSFWATCFCVQGLIWTYQKLNYISKNYITYISNQKLLHFPLKLFPPTIFANFTKWHKSLAIFAWYLHLLHIEHPIWPISRSMNSKQCILNTLFYHHFFCPLMLVSDWNETNGSHNGSNGSNGRPTGSPQFYLVSVMLVNKNLMQSWFLTQNSFLSSHCS